MLERDSTHCSKHGRSGLLLRSPLISGILALLISIISFLLMPLKCFIPLYRSSPIISVTSPHPPNIRFIISHYISYITSYFIINIISHFISYITSLPPFTSGMLSPLTFFPYKIQYCISSVHYTALLYNLPLYQVCHLLFHQVLVYQVFNAFLCLFICSTVQFLLPIFASCINNCTFSDISELYACIFSLFQGFDNTKSGCWWSAHKVCKSFHDEWHQSFQLTETCHMTLAIILRTLYV